MTEYSKYTTVHLLPGSQNLRLGKRFYRAQILRMQYQNIIFAHPSGLGYEASKEPQPRWIPCTE